ncbi:MAG: EAL domain-containing protein, partial [Thermoanaerobaculia bacterium]|nr:EAL domain-containing protein [Thermoanaerobaculia bacterium]
GYPLVQISLKGPDGEARVAEFAGSASGFVESLTVRWDETPLGSGPTGTAIRTGVQQFSDIASDERFEPWREQALAFGLSKSVSMPLTAKHHVLGALTLFAARGEPFDDADLEEIRGFSDEVSLSLSAAEHQKQIDLQNVALEAAPNAVVVTDVEGVILWVNPAFSRLTGYRKSEAVGRTPALLKSGRHPASFYAQMWKTLRAGQVWRGELYNRRKDGEIYLEDQTIAPLRQEDGSITHFVAVKQDITSYRKQEERIAHLFSHDGLTNLPNRHPLERTLQRVVKRARERPATLLMLGVDNFSLINETYGHVVGDEVLTTIAGILASHLRTGDFLARPGGDEFAIVLPSPSMDEGREIAERLRRAIESHRFTINGYNIRSTVSVGMIYIDGAMDPETLLMKADAALYSAKDLGRNRVFSHSTGESRDILIQEAGHWYSELNTALEEDRFLLHFQPVIALSSGMARHHEVLVRMIDRDGNLIYPDQFIPAAERFGLMPRLDLWVVRKTIDVLSRSSSVNVFVNLSGASLNHDEVLSSISEMITRADLAPGTLTFEITETVALNDLIRAQQWITRLRDLGCSFALDDFGVGFSSFSSLRALSVDFVKVDRSFVRDIDTNATNRALVEAVRAVAHTLGKQVIAEGVETDAHVGILTGLGVEYGQGYFWGRPSCTVWSSQEPRAALEEIRA